MTSCWQENPDNRPTFETLYTRFDEFMIQAEPSYREVKYIKRNANEFNIHLRKNLQYKVFKEELSRLRQSWLKFSHYIFWSTSFSLSLRVLSLPAPSAHQKSLKFSKQVDVDA
jgi:hypothetical protein